MRMLLQPIKNLARIIASATGLLSAYHYALSFFGALWYGFPSRRMTVIGVTGTKGKTTTCNLIAHILNSAGVKTGMATTVNFRIGVQTWTNDTKQTMLGRFALQKFLREMADAGCTHAVVETSSEGILQHRHRFIDYRVAVFTNLSPEHIERHGSFEAYRDTKAKLFTHVAHRADSIGVYNFDDPNVGYFLKPNVAKKIGYSYVTSDKRQATSSTTDIVYATDVVFNVNGTRFAIGNTRYATPLIGEFNLYNALAAIAALRGLGVPEDKIRKGLASAPQVPGRMEPVNKGQPFTVIVDYAHEPKSLEEVYKAAELFKPKKLIGLLGSQGGGRDVWKREAMGKIAGAYLDETILTNEDPYDEPPMRIIEDIEKGILGSGGRKKKQTVYKIIDRREAIKKALSLARAGDLVMLTGKGGEVWMCVEGGRKVAWDEKRIVEEILEGE